MNFIIIIIIIFDLRILMLHILSKDEVTLRRQSSWTPVQKPIFETFPSSRQNIFDNHLQRLIWDEWYFSKPNKSTTVFIIFILLIWIAVRRSDLIS